MALTASILKHRDNDLDERFQALLRTSLGAGNTGILPEYEYHASGTVSGRTYELPGLALTALLPTGSIIHVCEDLKIDIPVLNDGDYLLTVGKNGRTHEFECDDVPYLRPEYELVIISNYEMGERELFPLKKFVVRDGVLSFDEEYIPPVLVLCQNDAFRRYIERFVEGMHSICIHPNMQQLEGHHILLHYYSRLKSLNERLSVSEFAAFISETADSLDLVLSDGFLNDVEQIPDNLTSLKNDERRKPSFYDIRMFMTWFGEYLDVQTNLLNQVKKVDDSIDLDKLKKEIADDLYERLHTQLYEELYSELHDKMVGEVSDAVLDVIRSYIENKLSPELHDSLKDVLHGSLYQELYESLYAELSKLSFKPAEIEEDEFNPII